MLAVRLHVCVRCSMEGITRTAASRLARYRQDHPGAAIGHHPATGTWRAWIPDAPGSTSGTELRPCRHLDDLMDRLDALDRPGG